MASEDNGLFDLFKTLVEHGADINEVDEEGYNILRLVVRRNNLEMVKYLVEHGADVKTGNVGLCSAIEDGNFEIVKYLVEHGAVLNYQDDEYDDATPLTEAIQCGKFQIAKYLVEHGADVNIKGGVEGSPLRALLW